jgi:hypothetical protein
MSSKCQVNVYECVLVRVVILSARKSGKVGTPLALNTVSVHVQASDARAAAAGTEGVAGGGGGGHRGGGGGGGGVPEMLKQVHHLMVPDEAVPIII